MDKSLHSFPRSVLRHLSNFPFLLASTHGHYTSKSFPPFTLPPNVYVFETQEIGDYCLTSIDKPLLELLSNRDLFINYSTAAIPIASPINYNLVNVFKQFAFYEPGETIYNRLLSIGGGRMNNGKSARRVYDMDFYRFNSDTSRSKILEPLRTRLSDQSVQITMKEFIDSSLASYPDLKNGAIFFFSSCAESTSLTPAQKLTILSHQQKSRLKFLSYTPLARGGGIEEPSGFVPQSSTKGRMTEKFHPGAYTSGYIPGAMSMPAGRHPPPEAGSYSVGGSKRYRKTKRIKRGKRKGKRFTRR
jgi:hypothetical protein